MSTETQMFIYLQFFNIIIDVNDFLAISSKSMSVRNSWTIILDLLGWDRGSNNVGKF